MEKKRLSIWEWGGSWKELEGWETLGGYSEERRKGKLYDYISIKIYFKNENKLKPQEKKIKGHVKYNIGNGTG